MSGSSWLGGRMEVNSQQRFWENQHSTGGQSLVQRILAKITESRRNLFITAVVIALSVYLVATLSMGSPEIPRVDTTGVFGAWGSSFGHFSSSYKQKDPGPYNIAIIADLDKKSRVSEKKWRSVFRSGVLNRDGNTFSVTWGEDVDLYSAHSEGGRGMELSELRFYGDQLLTFDDRSGLVYEITKNHTVIPRVILMEGNGRTDKGQKTEWATVKDQKLYVGSFGKEYVNTETGAITNHNNLWVSVIHSNGVVHHEDWTARFEVIRELTDTTYPGYMIIEAIEWSDYHKRWFILPRRVSSEPYDDMADESRGANTIIVATSNFSEVDVWTVGTLDNPRRGFSAFKFLPGSDDSIIVALKSEENEKEGTQTTHISVFDVNLSSKKSTILMEETEIIGGMKFEGLTFMPRS